MNFAIFDRIMEIVNFCNKQQRRQDKTFGTPQLKEGGGYALPNKKHYTKCALPEICNYQVLDGERRFFLLRAVLTENLHRVCKNMIFVCSYALLSCILCFHACTHVCFHLISKVKIIKAFENRIPILTFEKWHNVSYCYVSCVKSATSDIWRTSAW